MPSLELPSSTKILAFGDSLTQGYGVLPQESYPATLASLLHVSVINEGISGEFSNEGLAGLPQLLSKHTPDILILCHGANDILRRKDLEQTKKNIEKMVELAHEKGIYVVLVGVPMYEILTFETVPFYYEIAKENGLVLEDKALEKILNSEKLKSDSVHPNAQGYALMAKNIAFLLEKHYIPSSKPF